MTGPSLFTMEWWLTVVVLSVALNLVAAYLKPRLDQVGGRISTRWAQQNAQRAEKRETRIEWAGRSDMNYITHRFRAVQARLHGVGNMFFAVLFMLGGTLAPHDKLPGVNLSVGDSAGLVGLLALALGTVRMMHGMTLDNEADAAFRKRHDDP